MSKLRSWGERLGPPSHGRIAKPVSEGNPQPLGSERHY